MVRSVFARPGLDGRIPIHPWGGVRLHRRTALAGQNPLGRYVKAVKLD
jgi:hypothetical protein